jgi:hypothetical protein
MRQPWLDDSLAANGRRVRDNFADWFGQSRILDAQGDPLVVYHGTHTNIEAFDPSEAQTTLSAQASSVPGFYFATQIQTANGHARTSEKGGGNVIAVHLSIQNPLRVEYAEFIGGTFERSELEKAGHDGVTLVRGGADWAHVAFRPEQIKSVHNAGLFARNSACLTDLSAARRLLDADKARRLVSASTTPPGVRHAKALAG